MTIRKTTILVFVVAVAAVAALSPGSGRAVASSGCTSVKGQLLDEHVTPAGSVGRMIGVIKGRYLFTPGGGVGTDPDATVFFGFGDATIETNKGTLRWHESSALDFANEDDFNTAVLATVTGGTGEWAGARGHVIMSGFFHLSTFTGQFDYRGEVCTASDISE
jgi:hypothetical protein